VTKGKELDMNITDIKALNVGTEKLLHCLSYKIQSGRLAPSNMSLTDLEYLRVCDKCDDKQVCDSILHKLIK
jgi:hypothetical protein